LEYRKINKLKNNKFENSNPHRLANRKMMSRKSNHRFSKNISRSRYFYDNF